MARRVLKHEDTVMLGEAVQSMKLKEKSLDAEVADFVFKSSHVWSMRHPERAKECFDQDIEVDIVTTKTKLKGLEPYVAVCFAIHDTFEDFRFEVHEIVYKGDLQDGAICYRFTAHGRWVKEIGGVKGHGKEVEIDGVSFMTMKNGKTSHLRQVVNNGADPEYVAAVVKQTQLAK